MSQTLILTLELNDTAQAFYEDLRLRYFPPDRNFIPAHLSLFHQLPEEEFVHHTLQEMARVTTKFLLKEPVPTSIGRGAAVFFQSKALTTLHASLSTAFQHFLIPQDRQRLRPHIVVQNKVDGDTARQTLSQLRTITLIEPQAVGLTLWRYLGGPWERLCCFPFEG